jgi:hypothetical protein
MRPKHEIDAVQLPRLMRSEDLTPVDVPQVEDEAIRDLGRAREVEAQRTLEGVRSRPWFGKAWVSSSGSAPQPQRPISPNTLEHLLRPSAVSARSFSPV